MNQYLIHSKFLNILMWGKLKEGCKDLISDVTSDCLKSMLSGRCLSVLCSRDTRGFSSVLLMAVIISKVTNAINMENSLLITQLALAQSSARFNLHNHSSNKQSFNHHAALHCNAQYSYQPIYRLSVWTLGHCEVQFTRPQRRCGQRRAFQ